MEDARKEFQIFMSPTKGSRERKGSPNKQRLVPVINKFFQPSTSSFMLTQRRNNIYKAVSGVSFQETDSQDKKRNKKKEANELRKERKTSHHQMTESLLPPRKGHETKRSRSLTSIEGQNTSGDPNKVEITHPFAPVILYTGRQSRYTKSKERRRAMSQNRAGIERIYDSNIVQGTPPERPRRTRSASRSIKSRSTTPQLSSSNPDDESTSQISFPAYANTEPTQEAIATSSTNGSIEYDIESKCSLTDFSVNGTDWKKYDAIVSEKLETIMKNKEEPEGGYFSLERDECEGDCPVDQSSGFQQDYCNESIYVSQVFAKDQACSKQDYPEDEGLYEEIYVDNADSFEIEETKQDNLINELSNSQNRLPRIEQGPTSTVVYITNTMSTQPLSITPEEKKLTKLKSFDMDRSSSTQFTSPTSKAWCNCYMRGGGLMPNFNHSSSCIQNKVNHLSANMSLLTDPTTESEGSSRKDKNEMMRLDPNNGRPRDSRKKLPFTKNSNTSCVRIRKSKSTGHFEADVELSDLDFDMFAPRSQRVSRLIDFQRNSSDTQEQRPARRRSKSSSNRKNGTVLSPSSFIDVLTDSRFNPPDIETSVNDDDASLVIQEDQIITCITDSSTDESEEECGSSSSPWLEATNDFEYVAFKEETPPIRRRKNGTPIKPNFFNFATSLVHSPNTSQNSTTFNENSKTPARPTRRRKRSKSRKRKENKEGSGDM